MASTSAWDWAVEEFGSASLGHAGRTRRVVRLAASFAARGTGLVTEAIVDESAREGAYRLLESKRAYAFEVAAASFRATTARCAPHPFVFVAVDGSSLNFADPLGVRGTGPIGDRKHGARGFLVTSALAVAPDGVPLGLLGQAWWRRGETPVTREASKRKVHEKETKHWLATQETVRTNLRETTCRPWFQEDRGGDAWPILRDFIRSGDLATVRASHNRRLSGPKGGERQYLWPSVEATAPIGTYALEVVGGPKRKARVTTMEVRAADVTLALRNHQTKQYTPAPVWAVLTREQTAPTGEPPIEWMLLTTYPVKSLEDARLVIHGYSQRWRVEEFHKAWKSGACHVEDMQLHDERGLRLLAVVLASIATRLLRLTYLARKSPDRPATDEFTPIEITAILRLKRKKRPRTKLTLAQVTTWVAELGGYTGKQSGGPPGFLTLGRGLRTVRDAVAVLTPVEEGIDEPE